jgi:hypothetical protein
MKTIIRAALPVLAVVMLVASAARGAGTEKTGKLRSEECRGAVLPMHVLHGDA